MNKILLSVAGYDPSFGAGISQDLKVFNRLGFIGMGVLTSLTAQNSKKVKSVFCLPPDFVKEQYQMLWEDFRIKGIKVGMLGCKENIQPVERILAENQDIPIVIDPVFKSSSGKWLLEKKAISYFIGNISHRACLLTPNCKEAGLITGNKTVNQANALETVKKIFELTKIPCLLTGLIQDKKVFNIVYDGTDIYQIELTKISRTAHGTGCVLSSSILGFLAQGHSIFESCQLGSEFTHKAILNSVPLGKGQDMLIL